MSSGGSLNKVMLIGNLGDDVKVTYFEGGGSVGRFPLATNETYVNRQTNEKVTNTEWHNIVVRNKAAEICEKYLKKGDKVYVEGRIRTRQWQDESGQPRYTTEIQVTDFTFLNNPPSERESGASSPQEHQRAPSVSQSQEPGAPTHVDEDDLPF